METDLSPEAKCHECGYQIEAATGLSGNTPSPGDVSICIACGTPEVFYMCPTGMITRPCTEEELVEVLQDEVVKNALFAIEMLRSHDPTWPKGAK